MQEEGYDIVRPRATATNLLQKVRERILELGRTRENHGMRSLQWTVSIELFPHLLYYLCWEEHKDGFEPGEEMMGMNHVGTGPDNMQWRNRTPDAIEMNFL